MASISYYVDEIKKAAKNKKVMGYCATFSVEGVEIQRNEVEKLFKKVGLDSELLPREVTPKRAFTKCINNLRAMKGIIVRQVAVNGGDEDKIVVHRIVSETMDAANVTAGDVEITTDANYHKDNLIVYDKENGTLKFEGAKYRKEIKEAFAEIFAKQLLNTHDIRRMIHNAVIRLGGIRLISRGGGFFVPVSDYTTLGKLEKICTALPGRVRFVGLPIARSEEAVEQVQTSAMMELEEKLLEIEEALENADQESTRFHLVARNKLADVKSLQQLTQLHAQNLRFDAEELEERMEKIITTLEG